MRSTLLTLAIAATLTTGCSDDESAPIESNVCDNFTTSYDDIVTGLTKAGTNELIQVEYVASTPSPPAEDDNTWSVRVSEMGGSALSDAVVTKVQPYMPDHGHGTEVVPTCTATGTEICSATDSDQCEPCAVAGDGMLDVATIDFRMVGVWTLTYTVETGGQVDTATFGVCIN